MSACSDKPLNQAELAAWTKVYVGDDYDKDILGAINAGWHAVFFNKDAQATGKDVYKLEENGSDPFSSLPKHRIVEVSSLKTLARSL